MNCAGNKHPLHFSLLKMYTICGYLRAESIKKTAENNTKYFYQLSGNKSPIYTHQHTIARGPNIKPLLPTIVKTNCVTSRPFLYMGILKNYSTHAFQKDDCVEIAVKITKEDVEKFSRLSGDTNPIHTGEKAVVHGAYLNALVSGVIGTKLPGAGTLVVSQNLRFPNKCFVGDDLNIYVRLTSVRKLLHVDYKCCVRDKTVLEGDAKLILDK